MPKSSLYRDQRQKLSMAAVAACGAVCILIFSLYFHNGLTTRPTALPSGRGQIPLRLTASPATNGTVIHSHTFDAGDPKALTNMAAIELLLATYNQEIPIERVVLYSAGRACVFRNDTIEVLEDNRFVKLSMAGCDQAVFQQMTLEIVSRTAQPIALWVSKADTAAVVAPLKIQREMETLLPSGRIVASDAPQLIPAKQIQMLSHIWGGGPLSPSLLLMMLVGALICIFMGCSAILLSTRHWLIFVPAGFALIAFGFGLIYSLTAPPFQAPDEADHFLTYLDMNQLEAEKKDALLLASTSHYSRLMCNVNEKYALADAKSPLVMTWPSHVGLTNIERRSALGNRYWKILGSILPDIPTNGLHLVVRVCNSFLIALSVFLALLVIGSGLACKKSLILAALPVFLVPTIWFFGSHISNHVFLIASYMVLAFAVNAVFGRAAKTTIYLLVGISLATALLAGRAAVIAALIWGLVLVVNIFARWLASKEKPNLAFYSHQILHLILAFAPALFVFAWFHETSYIDTINRAIGPKLKSLAPWWYAVIAVVLICSFVTAWLLKKHQFQIEQSRIYSVLQIGLMVGLIGIVFIPFFRDIAATPNIEGVRPRVSGLSYVKTVLTAFIGNWGIGGFDFYLNWSFWGGFGCPEPVVGHSLVRWLHTGVLVAIIATFFRAFRNPSFPVFIQHLAMLALSGLYLALLAYATATLRSPFNLHGRYMVGFYLLTIGYFVPQALGLSVDEGGGGKHAGLICAGMLLSILVIHAIAINDLLNRYFA